MRDGAVWARLERDLGTPDVHEHAGDARVGATLALITESRGGYALLYTRRRDDLRTHPGQISFPGGRVDPGETIQDAAVREAVEEVALDPRSVTILGALPTFYVPPSRYWLQTVVARWDRPHRLRASEDEVAEIITADVSDLTDPERWRSVRLSVSGWSWAWQLDDDHLLWGATAAMTAALLDHVVPGWNRGRAPADLGPDREVRPWLHRRTEARNRARLPGAPERPASGAGRPWPSPAAEARVTDAATAVVTSARALAEGSVAVLVGGGGNGRAGAVAARRLQREGRRVIVVPDRPVDALPAVTQAALEGVDVRALSDDLPRADLFVDALVGAGLRGPLRAGARDLVLALRRSRAPVLALDVPTGIHPQDGLIGDCAAAAVTLTLGGPQPGLSTPGIEPFVGDLYEIGEGGRLTRLLPHAPAGWRE